MKILKTIISSLKHTKLLIVIFFILSILLNYLITYIPVVIQYFIDILLKQDVHNTAIQYFINLWNGKLSFIPTICILLLLIEGVIVLSTYVRTIVKNKIIQEFQFDLKLKLFEHIQNLSYQDFYQNSLADLVQNMVDDVNHIVSFIEKQFTYILDITLIIIFAITQLVNLDLRLSTVMIVAVSSIILLSIWYFKKSKPVIENRMKVQRELYSNLNDNYSNLKFMKINNLQEKEKDGSIVILDEVTSNLDLEFEKNVMEANKAILKNKISFVIAHRINTVKDADLIILIEDKKIVEMGRHEELIQKQGYYYNLYMSKETAEYNDYEYQT